MKRALASIFAFVIVALLGAPDAAAQSSPPCVPPFCVHVETPPARVETPPVDVRAQAAAEAAARAQADAAARARAELEARRAAWAQWRAYFEWDASIRASAEASAMAQLDARFHAELATMPDRYAFAPPPITPPPTYPSYGSGAELGFVPVCAGLWSGTHAPVHAGFCPDLRFRLDDTWSVTIDPSLAWFWNGEKRGDVTLGASPGVAWSFVHGDGRLWRAHAFVSGGLDIWIPLEGGRANPDWFGGAHLGIGAHAFNDSHVGFGAEVRGLAKRGFGTSGFEEAELRSTLRVGFDARLLVMASF